MNYNLDLLREANIDLYNRAVDAEKEVKFLEQELQEAQEVLDGIEEILLNELDAETAHRIYNKIFHIN